jgi:excisionase family DNA binding protein
MRQSIGLLMATTIEREKIVYTLKEAAELLRVQPSTVRAKIEEGKLVKLPLRHIRIPYWSLEKLVGGPLP